MNDSKRQSCVTAFSPRQPKISVVRNGGVQYSFECFWAPPSSSSSKAGLFQKHNSAGSCMPRMLQALSARGAELARSGEVEGVAYAEHDGVADEAHVLIEASVLWRFKEQLQPLAEIPKLPEKAPLLPAPARSLRTPRARAPSDQSPPPASSPQLGGRQASSYPHLVKQLLDAMSIGVVIPMLGTCWTKVADWLEDHAEELPEDLTNEVVALAVQNPLFVAAFSAELAEKLNIPHALEVASGAAGAAAGGSALGTSSAGGSPAGGWDAASAVDGDERGREEEGGEAAEGEEEAGEEAVEEAGASPAGASPAGGQRAGSSAAREAMEVEDGAEEERAASEEEPDREGMDWEETGGAMDEAGGLDDDPPLSPVPSAGEGSPAAAGEGNPPPSGASSASEPARPPVEKHTPLTGNVRQQRPAAEMQRAAKTPRRAERSDDDGDAPPSPPPPRRREEGFAPWSAPGAPQTAPHRQTGPPPPTQAARAAARAVGPDSRLSSMLSDTQKLASRLRGELRTLRGEAARLRGEAAAAARTYGWLLREYSARGGRPGLLAIERAANVISCTPRALAQLCGMLAQSRIAET